MNKEIQKHYNLSIHSILCAYLDTSTPFRLVLQNIDNWSEPLHTRILEMKSLVIDIADASLEDSFVDDNADINIQVELDGILFNKILDIKEVQSIIDYETKTPLIIKPFIDFIEEPKEDKLIELNDKIVRVSDTYEDKKGMLVSLLAFKENNPNKGIIDKIVKLYE